MTKNKGLGYYIKVDYKRVDYKRCILLILTENLQNKGVHLNKMDYRLIRYVDTENGLLSRKKFKDSKNIGSLNSLIRRKILHPAINKLRNTCKWFKIKFI